MNKRKLIRKLAIPAAIIAVVSLLGLLLQIPISDSQYKTHKEVFKKYINSLMDQNKTYLKGIAAKIKSLPADQVVVNELESEYVMEHQKSDQPKKYLWMSTLNGDYLFGVPSASFQKLNDAFDKYQNTIKLDEYYRSRNDFLNKLIDVSANIDLTQFDKGSRGDRDYSDNHWRYYNGEDDWGLFQPTSISFSTPVYDINGKLIGDLYMKVDDKVNIEKYYSEQRFRRSDFLEALTIICGILLGLSGAFLWFLLPTWVYNDAQERDVKTPGVWAFLTLTSLVFGLTIYLLTRPANFKSFSCPKCEGELNGTRAYCPHCGYDLSNTFCQQCQYPIKPEWKFCPNCRTETKAKDEITLNNETH